MITHQLHFNISKKNRACGGLFMITILLLMYTHKLLRLHSKIFAPAAGFSGSLSYYSCKRTNYCDYNIITLVILGPDTCNLTNYADYPNFPAITQIIQPNTHEISKSLEIWLPLNKGRFWVEILLILEKSSFAKAPPSKPRAQISMSSSYFNK